MPSISRFFGITIYMYKNDHNPPHFHAFCEGFDCTVDINKAKASGKFPKDKKKIVEAWTILHREELFNSWDSLMRSGKVIEVEPLK